MNVQLYCKTCGAGAKRQLLNQPGCRGAHETAHELAFCPKGHGEMARRDGAVVVNYLGMRVLHRFEKRVSSLREIVRRWTKSQ